ncbi:MAG: MFS transporter [Phycisphaerae bacterium]
MTNNPPDPKPDQDKPVAAPASPANSAPPQAKSTWAALLAINSSTGALLGAILLVCMGSELWDKFLPKYMQDLFRKDQVLSISAAVIMTIAVYGTFRDFLEAVNYLLGGWIAGKFNTRRGLLLFNAAPLAGLAILFLWHNTIAVFLAIPFVFVWDSLAGPALLTVVGDSLPSDRRAMAFSMQSLLRRLARVIAYGVNAGIVVAAGRAYGASQEGQEQAAQATMHAAFAISFVVVLASLLVQMRFMKTASEDKGTIIHKPLSVLRGFDPQLKRLLAADIFARLAEGMPRELFVIFIVPALMVSTGMEYTHAWAVYGVLLIVSQVTSAITYLPMGALASKPGLGKRPYIGLTFFFFATFPAVLAGMGYLAVARIAPASLVILLMGVAYVFAGMREIGEPARKAMIVDLIPPAMKTQSIGIYWSARCVAVMLAPIVGGAVWVGANLVAGRSAVDPTGPGPFAMMLASSLCGAVGVVYYYARFGK